MTKGALRQRYIPLDPEWHDSDLFRALATDFGLGGPTVWLVLHAEWREPEAEIIDRDGQRGLYRRCRFSYIWDKLPGIGNKKLAKIMHWLHDRGQWVLDPDSLQDINRLSAVGQQSMHRTDTQTRHLVGAWSAKWLMFREACFAYRRGEEKRGEEGSSTESNQDEEKLKDKYVWNKERDEYDRIPVAEANLREDLDD